jgi:hypothetical protein
VSAPFEAELAAAAAAAAAANAALQRVRVQQALVAAGMPAEQAATDLAVGLLDVPVGSDDDALQQAAERVRASLPHLFPSQTAAGAPTGQKTTAPGSEPRQGTSPTWGAAGAARAAKQVRDQQTRPRP